MTWRSLQGEVVVALRAAGVAEPEAEARRIVAEAAGCSPAELVLIGGDEPTTLPAAHVARMLERRCAGEPLQYVLGSWGFRSLDLFVDGRVLIPRPETEVVTERALTEVDRCAADGHRPIVVDLGTGSGAIGLSVAVERERAAAQERQTAVRASPRLNRQTIEFLRNEPAQRVDARLDFRQFKRPAEIVDIQVGVSQEGFFVDSLERRQVGAFIRRAEIAHDRLDEILHCDEPRETAVFVHDEGHLRLCLAEMAQHGLARRLLGNKADGSNHRLDGTI